MAIRKISSFNQAKKNIQKYKNHILNMNKILKTNASEHNFLVFKNPFKNIF